MVSESTTASLVSFKDAVTEEVSATKGPLAPLITAMTLYIIIGAFAFHEYLKTPPGHKSASSRHGDRDNQNSGRRIRRDTLRREYSPLDGSNTRDNSPSPSTSNNSPSQKRSGEMNRKNFYHHLLIALIIRIVFLPLGYMFTDHTQITSIVSWSLPNLSSAMAYSVLVLFYAQVVATVSGTPNAKAKEQRENERASQEQEYDDLDETSADRMLDQQEGAGTDKVVDAAVFDKEAPDDDPFEPAVPVQLPAPDTMEDEDDLFATDAALPMRKNNKDGDMEVELPTIPKVVRPTLDRYKAKWAFLLEYHSRGNDEAYSLQNLVPTPQHVLWQDCPHVPFSDLKSQEAQARLSMARPIFGLHEAGDYGGVP